MKRICQSIFIGVLALFSTGTTNASIVVQGTRLVFPGNSKNATIQINNPDKTPYLIQSWTSTSPTLADKTPFLVTPPLFRLEPDGKTTLRVLQTEEMAQDKESLYWLNIKAIPSVSEDQGNAIVFAIKTQIKLIYRPKILLKNTPGEFIQKLSWQKIDKQIAVTNNSAYYMNFSQISISGKPLKNITYVAPGGTARFDLPVGVEGSTVEFTLITDQGATSQKFNAALK